MHGPDRGDRRQCVYFFFHFGPPSFLWGGRAPPGNGRWATLRTIANIV
jgi:hypothetical protein